MFSSDEIIGVRPSDNYKFFIILSPTGPYYAAPMRIYVEEKYVRAVEGGVGYAKTSGNYAAAMYATALAKKQGYDQYYTVFAFRRKCRNSHELVQVHLRRNLQFSSAI